MVLPSDDLRSILNSFSIYTSSLLRIISSMFVISLTDFVFFLFFESLYVEPT